MLLQMGGEHGQTLLPGSKEHGYQEHCAQESGRSPQQHSQPLCCPLCCLLHTVSLGAWENVVRTPVLDTKFYLHTFNHIHNIT